MRDFREATRKADSSETIIGSKRKVGALGSLLRVEMMESKTDYHLKAGF